MRPLRARAFPALAAGLVVLAAFAPVAATVEQPGTGGQEQQGPAASLTSPPAPLPLHSTACQLAGGWCPVHDQDGVAQLVGWGGISGSSHPAAAAASNSSRGGEGSRAAAATRRAPPQAQATKHKPLWPLSGWDVAGIGASALALLLAASGGIGGGGILVPVYLMILGEICQLDAVPACTSAGTRTHHQLQECAGSAPPCPARVFISSMPGTAASKPALRPNLPLPGPAPTPQPTSHT